MSFGWGAITTNNMGFWSCAVKLLAQWSLVV